MSIKTLDLVFLEGICEVSVGGRVHRILLSIYNSIIGKWSLDFLSKAKNVLLSGSNQIPPLPGTIALLSVLGARCRGLQGQVRPTLQCCQMSPNRVSLKEEKEVKFDNSQKA